MFTYKHNDEDDNDGRMYRSIDFLFFIFFSFDFDDHRNRLFIYKNCYYYSHYVSFYQKNGSTEIIYFAKCMFRSRLFEVIQFFSRKFWHCYTQLLLVSGQNFDGCCCCCPAILKWQAMVITQRTHHHHGRQCFSFIFFLVVGGCEKIFLYFLFAKRTYS